MFLCKRRRFPLYLLTCILFSPLSSAVLLIASAQLVTSRVCTVFETDLANLQMAAFVEHCLQYPEEMKFQMGETVSLIHDNVCHFALSVCLKDGKQHYCKTFASSSVCLSVLPNDIRIRSLDRDNELHNNNLKACDSA